MKKIVCVIFFSFLFFAGCDESLPEIVLIDPKIGRMDDILTIRGSGFGDERDESYVTISGILPTTSSYLSWSENEITVRIPEFGDAGLVYVHRGKNKSNPAMLANQANLPEPVRSPETGVNPRIISVEPSSAPIGSLITIQGSNFGASRENGAVYFSWDAESSPSTPAGVHSPDFVESLDSEFAYEFWSDREIRVRVPDGAISGNLEIRTPRGNSRPVFFEITGKPGTKLYRDKRSYILSYMVDIRVERASAPNALYIWMPRPAVSASQRNVQIVSRSAEPFVENFRGSSLFQLVDIPALTNHSITMSYVAEVYAVETSIRTQAPLQLNKRSPLAAVFTIPSALVPSGDERIITRAAEIAGRERYPYAKARRIYEWLISEAGVYGTRLSGGAVEALEGQLADSYGASLLFCALARAQGIPAIPVSGVLVNRLRGTTRHYWAEFWLDGFGWVPVDPALGAGTAPPDFNLRDDHAEYYFGSLDNQRVAFSRGEQRLSQMSPRGRITQRTREYSLQNLWEEASGGLESYSSLWGDVTITGVYVE